MERNSICAFLIDKNSVFQLAFWVNNDEKLRKKFLLFLPDPQI